jgi:hypothetical protein
MTETSLWDLATVTENSAYDEDSEDGDDSSSEEDDDDETESEGKSEVQS